MFLSSLLGVGIGWPAVAYLVNPSQGTGEAGWSDAGALDAIPEGQPTELQFEREKDDAWNSSVQRTTAWVVRDGEQVTAYGPQCTHLGCGYRWVDEEKVFLCPCHDTRFAMSGEVLSGVAPRPLDRYDVRIDDGRLWLGEIEESEA
jgi:menaquinol-cytochrome c reductase iron-sulfur subunit